MRHVLLIGLFLMTFAPVFIAPIRAFAQAVEVNDSDNAPTDKAIAPAHGKDKANQYFLTRKPNSASRGPAAEGGAGATPRFLAIHIGRMFADEAYKWGHEDQKNIGGLNAGVTYRLGEWVNSMDLAMRIEYTSYSLVEDPARKVSIGALVTFPDANSRFPLYFGAGLGAGLFIKQLHAESVLALDYQVVAGARFLNVFDNVGLMVESGVKNHLFLLSDGQYNGVFINVGAVFAF